MKKAIQQIIFYIKKTYPLLKPNLPKNVLSIIFDVIATVMKLLFPLCIKYLIDSIALVGAWDRLIPFSLLTVGIIIIKQCSDYLSCVFVAEFTESSVSDARTNIFRNILRKRISFFHTAQDGDIVTRIMTDSGYIATLLSYTTAKFLTSILQIVMVFIILFIMNPLLAGITAVTVPVFLLLNNKYGGALNRQLKYHRKCLGELNNFYIENVRNIKHIKNYVLENEVQQAGDEESEKMKQIQITTEKTGYRFYNLMQTSVDIDRVLVLVLGGLFVSNGTFSIGALTAFLTYVSYVYDPFVAITTLYNNIAGALASLERYFEFMDDDGSSENLNDSGLKVNGIDSIELENVAFSYNGHEAGETPTKGNEVLKDANLRINKNDKLYLTGKSGQGKSTLSSLLKRFYDVSGGRILLNGKDISEYNLESLRKSIYYVSQESVFFNKSIRDNFRLVYGDITDERIIDCLKHAQIYEELFDGTHNGLDTVLSQNGTNMSGGQRQRLQIAMLFACSSDTVVLDEPFTGVDSGTVNKIWDELKKYLEDKTVILIDHNFHDQEFFTKTVMLEDAKLNYG